MSSLENSEESQICQTRRLSKLPLRSYPKIRISTRWYAWLINSAWAGLLKVIAEHSVPTSLGESEITLLLSPEHDALLNDAQVKNLQRSLSELLSSDVNVRVEWRAWYRDTCSAQGATAGRNVRPRQKRPCHDDETVQSLLADFDGGLSTPSRERCIVALVRRDNCEITPETI